MEVPVYAEFIWKVLFKKRIIEEFVRDPAMAPPPLTISLLRVLFWNKFPKKVTNPLLFIKSTAPPSPIAVLLASRLLFKINSHPMF